MEALHTAAVTGWAVKGVRWGLRPEYVHRVHPKHQQGIRRTYVILGFLFGEILWSLLAVFLDDFFRLLGFGALCRESRRYTRRCGGRCGFVATSTFRFTF
jgi:hypothetical protein